MGYQCNLQLDKQITHSDVQKIVDELPNRYVGNYIYFGEQNWGWPCVCDIKLPQSNVLSITGSYSISGMYCEEFVSYLVHKLDMMDFEVDVNWED